MLISKTRQELADEVDALKRQVGNLRSMQRMNQVLADSLLPDEGHVKVTLPINVAEEIAGWHFVSPTLVTLIAACKQALEEWA